MPDHDQFDLDAIYQEHSREIWAIVYARWQDADLAHDIMQESFFRLWKKWQDGEVIHNPRAWLRRVARNLAEDHGRSAFRRNGTHGPEILNGLPSGEPPPLEMLECRDALTLLPALESRLCGRKNGKRIFHAFQELIEGPTGAGRPSTKFRREAVEAYLELLAERRLLDGTLNHVIKRLGCREYDILKCWGRVHSLEETASKLRIPFEEIQLTWITIIRCVVALLQSGR